MKIDFMVCIVLSTLVMLGICIIGNKWIGITTYKISKNKLPVCFTNFRVAQISDFHNETFKDDNELIIAKLMKQEVDIIVITGDYIDSRRTDCDVALSLAKRLAQVAPVYYVTGNHESRINEFRVFVEDLTKIGVTVLRNEKVTIEKKDMCIQLLGIDDPSFRDDEPMDMLSAEIVDKRIKKINSEGFTILLSHRPDLFETYVANDIDLVLCGHAHGGQFRVPFMGGILAPNQGFFPRYDCGVYSKAETSMVVSRGLGNSSFPLRVNNNPEIVIVNLEQ